MILPPIFSSSRLGFPAFLHSGGAGHGIGDAVLVVLGLSSEGHKDIRLLVFGEAVVLDQVIDHGLDIPYLDLRVIP